MPSRLRKQPPRYRVIPFDEVLIGDIVRIRLGGSLIPEDVAVKGLVTDPHGDIMLTVRTHWDNAFPVAIPARHVKNGITVINGTGVGVA